MNARFDVANDGLFVTVANTNMVYGGPGAYVAVDIHDKRSASKDEPEGRQISMLLKKSEARAIASAMMGAAGEL